MKLRKVIILAALTALSCARPVFPLPEGETIIEGSATFDRSEVNVLKINAVSDKLIVDYNSFNIAAGESVYFYQPSATSAALNRVQGSDASNIFGTLTANGIIYLVNPNGINIGLSANINAASFIASTLNISNNDFLNNNLVFSKLDKNSFIINQGKILVRNGGYVCLLAGAVENAGTIEANLGNVVLASGEKVTLALDDLNEISVVVDEAVREKIEGFNSAVKNSGAILANGGKVILTAKVLNNVFDYAINNSGIIEANSVVNRNGVIELVAEGAPVVNSGSIITNGSVGLPDAGRISIEAGMILQQGLISANALESGIAGQIDIISESSTILDTNSVTEARAAGLAGTGGRITVNSNGGNTTVNTNAVIDVSAGSVSGNGGFIEVSAFEQLGFYGILNGRAPPGYLTGTAILDPPDADIGGGTGGSPATFNINTTVYATRHINIEGNVTIAEGVTLNLFADHNSPASDDWDNGAGQIKYKNGSESSVITGTGATLNLKAGDGIGTSDSPIKINVSNLSAEINPDSSGDIYLNQGSASLTLNSIATLNGLVSIISGGAISDGNGDSINITATDLILSAASGIGSGDVLETEVSNLSARVASAGAAGNIEITNGIDLILSDLDSWGYAVKNFGSGNIIITVDSDNSDLTVNAPVISASGNIDLTAKGTGYAYIDVESPLTVDSGSGRIKLEASNTITSSDETGDSSSNDAEIYINAALSTLDGDITLEAFNNITRDVSTADSIEYYDDYSYNYAQIYFNSGDISSANGDITISAFNTLTTYINKDTDPVSEIYQYTDNSYNEAYVYIYGAISTAGNIDISSTNTITREINVDHIGRDNGGWYEGGYYDYSYNYAYLDIEDTLDAGSLTGTNPGSVTLSALNTTNNTITANGYIAQYYYEYYEDYSNYAEIYLNNTIYSDLGNITLTAKNDITHNINAGYLDYFYDYSDNETYIYSYYPVYSQTGNIKLEAANSIDTDITVNNEGGVYDYDDYTYSYAYISVNDTVSTKGHSEEGQTEGIDISTKNTLTRDITASSIDSFDYEPYSYAYTYIYGDLTTARAYNRLEDSLTLLEEGDGKINLFAVNEGNNNLEVTDNINQYDNQPYNYAYINTQYVEIESLSGDITLKASNTLTTNINTAEGVEPVNEIYEYEDYSDNEAEVYLYNSADFETISTAGNIGISAANTITREINADHIGQYNGDWYEGGYYDYSYNYAYLDIEDTLDAGSVTLSALNTVDNTITVNDYISQYYYEYYDSYSNYAEIGAYDTIYTDAGNITLTAKNDITHNINAGYIDYFYDYSDNEAYIYSYALYSQTGDIKLEAANSIDTEVTANSEGGLYDYDDYAYSNAYVQVNDTVSTKGHSEEGQTEGIDISTKNTLIRNITASSIDSFDYEPYSYAYTYIYGDLTTAETYDRSLGSLVPLAEGNGKINLSATNEVVNNVEVSDEPYDYSDYSDNDAEVYVYAAVSTDAGDITITADTLTINSDVTANTGDIIIKNSTSAKPFAVGDGAGGDIVLDSSEITYLSSGGKIIIGSDTAGTITIGNDANFGDNDVELISGDSIIDSDLEARTITGDSLTLRAVNGIGRSYNFLNTNVTKLDAETTGDAAGIYVDETDGLEIGAITAGPEGNRGDVSIKAGNSIKDADDDDISGRMTNITGASVTLNAGDDIGESTNTLEVVRKSLDYTYRGDAYIYPSPDSTPPAGSVSINSNDTYTNELTITLSLSAEDVSGVTAYRVANGDNASEADIVEIESVNSFEGIISWDLPAGDGTKTVSVQYRDAIGNWSENFSDSIILDQTPPVVTATPDIAPNAAGWNKDDVTVNFSATDTGGSGVVSIDPDVIVNTEGTTLVNGTATDAAGNVGTSATVTVKLDKTLPEITATRTAANANGWNNTDVTVSYSVSDALSGVDDANPLTDYSDDVVSSEGANQSVEGVVYDKAGNSATITTEDINIDKTAPVVDIIDPLDGYTYTSAQTLLYTATDDNLDTVTGPDNGTVYSAVGPHTVDLTATDLAGNNTAKSISFSIIEESSVILETQLSNSAVYRPIVFSSGALGMYRFNTFDPMGGPVYFYHPLTEADMSAFEGMEEEQE